MINRKHYDVLIVGAGPAGAVIAYEIKRAIPDLDILVIEKNSIPRYKVCGGGIQAKAVKILPFNIDPVVEDTIFGITFSNKYQNQFTRISDSPLIYNVMRDKFDAFLIQKALDLGVFLLDNEPVKQIHNENGQIIVNTSNYQLTCGILIGADGVMSIVAKSFGLMENKSLSFGIETEVNVPPEIIEKHRNLITVDCGTIKSGYAWIFPKSNHLSIGVGTNIRYARKLKSYYQNLLSHLNLGEYTISFSKGFLIPHRKINANIQTQNVLLIGDAAGLVDAFTGEGIYYAIRSAQLAASIVIEKLKDPRVDLMEYQYAVDRELMPELEYAQSLLKLFNLAPGQILKATKRYDRFWRAICRMLRGERTYKSYVDASKEYLGHFQFLLKLAGL